MERPVPRESLSRIKGCAVLLIADEGDSLPQQGELTAIGFRVVRAADLPCDGTLLQYEGVVAALPVIAGVGRLAARVRAQRHFGRRVLIALVPDHVPEAERRRAAVAGTDAVLPRSVTGRTLAAHILRRLRECPEHRCKLVPHRPRPAA